MLDIKLIRTETERVKKALARRKEDIDIDKILALDEKKRSILFETEELKRKQNEVSKKIPALKKAGEDTTEIFAEMKELSDTIKKNEAKRRELEEEFDYLMLRIPNIPNDNVPDGSTDDDNVEIRKWGGPRKFDFDAKPHWDLAESLGIIDFERAAKIAGSRFSVYKGQGARLERSVINFFLDTHTGDEKYIEVFPPYMVNRGSMMGTGQLPKFEEDAFKVSNNEFFLIPTAEVPVTNLYKDEIFLASDLPIYHAAYSACFRAEAGSAGRDTRGLIRQHQFNKVELVKFVHPKDSYSELEALVNDAERLLQILEIPYRIVKICVGDLGFTAAFKYDIEVWMPSYGRYVEISSCSNFEDFQARRANIKFKETINDKAQFLHTLNGSGLAVGRTVAAIMENCQTDDGRIKIPKALQKYMGDKEYIG